MWVEGFWAVAVWGAVVGSVLLLARSKIAGPVFIVSLVSMLVTTVHNYVLTDGVEMMGTAAIAFSAVIFLIAVGEVLYSRAMCNRGVLR